MLFMVRNTSNQVKGFVFLILAAALYSTMPILGKFMYQTGLTPVSVLILRYFFALLMLMGYLAWRRRPILTSSPYALIQGLAFIGGSLLYFNAIKYLPAGLAAAIFYMYPVMVSLLAIVVYKEKLTGRQVVALMLALTGIVIVSGILVETTQRLSPLGVAQVIASSICYAIYTLLGQKTTKGGNALTLTATLSLCGLTILALVFPRELLIFTHISLEQALLGFAVALFNTVLSIFFYLKGLAIIGASRAALVSTAEPAFTLLFAFILLSEIISPLQGLGIILILTSTTLALKPKR